MKSNIKNNVKTFYLFHLGGGYFIQPKQVLSNAYI